MISGLGIKRFRGITECDISGFKDINIFTGRNNQGKSSLLEAMYLASAAFLNEDRFKRKDNKILYLLNRRSERGLSWEFGRQILWNGYDKQEPILIEIQYGKPVDERDNAQSKRKVRIEFVDSYREPFVDIPRVCLPEDTFLHIFGTSRGRPPDSLRLALTEGTLYLRDAGFNPGRSEISQLLERVFPDFTQIETYMKRMVFIDANLMHTMEKVEKALWSDLLRDRCDKLVTEVLREGYQVGIEDLTYMPIGEMYQLAAKLSKTTIRVDDLGDGARYSMVWMMAAAILRNTAILIEEPESHQHPGGLIRSLEALFDLSRRNGIQIFATSHSLEFIKIVERIAEEKKLGVSTFFIEMDAKGRVDSRLITSDDSNYLAKMGVDIRFLDSL